MERIVAQTLIEDTFNQPFDEGRFRNFIINLLNDVDESKAFPYLFGSYIKDSFKEHVSKYRRIGTYTDPSNNKIDILLIHLKNPWALERSRTMLRNFTAEYLKNRNNKDAALIGYYTDELEDWRFSFVKMEYKLQEKDTGKIKIRVELTPAKRYSYLVGMNEPNHTAQAQLIGILEDDNNNPTLSDIEEAFSVDKVSKQFYIDYRSQFEKLWDELNDIISKDPKIAKEFESKSIDTANFAKKLLGQIVFLYFLQKKGWLGVGKNEKGNFRPWGTGPKNFMQRLFDKEFTDYGNFFNDMLEPLFYEALATERPNDIFSHFNCKIPFLNGGLFEPLNDYNWEETDIRIDNDLMADVFKTFNQYNFTVREDEPLEKEVAIDPEMLGKVFENLLPENLRKGKGSYYTPRTIVHYMCQESLINYLANECPEVSKDDIDLFIRLGEQTLEYEKQRLEKTNANEDYSGAYKNERIPDSISENSALLDDALSNIKVCDPAIGSGAFPVGMLNEIVKAQHVLGHYLGKERSIYDLKRHCIQNSLYGVDIDPGAIEIAKLRLWLSLVVDEDDYNTIQPLPNLDYKIMQGNSLIEEFHGISLDLEKKEVQNGLFDDDTELDALVDDLQSNLDKFFNAVHHKEKADKRESLENTITAIFHHQLRGQKSEYFNEYDKVVEISKSLPGQQRGTYINDELMKLQERFNFNHSEIENELKEMTHGNKVRNFFPWKLYYADVFLEKGGFDIVIANPPYIRHEKLEPNVKELLVNKYPFVGSTTSDIYVYFFDLGIQISKESGVILYISLNKWMKTKYGKGLRKRLQEKQTLFVIDFFELPVFDASTDTAITLIINSPRYQETKYYPIKTLKNLNLHKERRKNHLKAIMEGSEWQFYFKEEVPLMAKYYEETVTLKDFVNDRIFSGIKTGLNKAFVLDDIVAKRLKKSESSKIIMPYARSKDIKKWKLDNENRFFLATGYDLNIKTQYPTVYEFLEKFEYELKKRQDQGNKWYNLRVCSYYHEFFHPKLIYMHTAKNHEFYLDQQGRYINNSCYMIISDSKYLFFYLNSSLFRWFKSKKFVAYGDASSSGRVKLDYNKMIVLPIKKIGTEDNKYFEKKYMEIKSEYESKEKQSTHQIESDVNNMLYKLYGLTDDEIKIVEGSVD